MSRLRARKEAIDEFAAAVEGRMRPVADADLVANENGHPNGKANGNGNGAPARRPLGQLLVQDGAVTGAQLEAALAHQTASGQRLGEILLASGAVSEHALTNALADQHGL